MGYMRTLARNVAKTRMNVYSIPHKAFAGSWRKYAPGKFKNPGDQVRGPKQARKKKIKHRWRKKLA